MECRLSRWQDSHTMKPTSGWLHAFVAFDSVSERWGALLALLCTAQTGAWCHPGTLCVLFGCLVRCAGRVLARAPGVLSGAVVHEALMRRFHKVEKRQRASVTEVVVEAWMLPGGWSVQDLCGWMCPCCRGCVRVECRTEVVLPACFTEVLFGPCVLYLRECRGQFGSMVDNLQAQSSASFALVFRGLSPAHHTSTHAGTPATFTLQFGGLSMSCFVGHH